ncbi:flavin reductase family protein [Streptomyces sp. NBC_00083]|uniref:flavin reductase family protein n=1 Tax=Streptomyces sp. NBC_00083 TaxID=2975647 RepID=UPI00225828D2|nr:flavin reductase family protein [Streptomyces sp. NBC_00083]MCX5387103.1 flavin reductase family protein [Streptomyces sp. NBC_00083]
MQQVSAQGSAMDDFLDRLDYPMYVVTAVAGQQRAGCLVGFASQCSMVPVRFMVWLSTANRTYRVARSADVLAVHQLGRAQYDLAEHFGGLTGDDVDKFAGIRCHEGPAGTVLLDDAPAWFVGRVEGHLEGGDHVGFLLSPLEASDAQLPLPGGELFRLSDSEGIEAGHPVQDA